MGAARRTVRSGEGAPRPAPRPRTDTTARYSGVRRRCLRGHLVEVERVDRPSLDATELPVRHPGSSSRIALPDSRSGSSDPNLFAELRSHLIREAATLDLSSVLSCQARRVTVANPLPLIPVGAGAACAAGSGRPGREP